MLGYFDKISVLQLECSLAYLYSLSYNAANLTCHSQSSVCTYSATEESFYANCSRWRNPSLATTARGKNSQFVCKQIPSSNFNCHTKNVCALDWFSRGMQKEIDRIDIAQMLWLFNETKNTLYQIPIQFKNVE